MTIREYAERAGVSYEAIRKQICRNMNVLQPHISKDGRTQILDSYAVEFLDNLRKNNAVVVQQSTNREELEKLRSDVTTLQNALIMSQETVVALLKEKNTMPRLEDFEDLKNKLAEVEAERDALKNRGFFERILNR